MNPLFGWKKNYYDGKQKGSRLGRANSKKEREGKNELKFLQCGMPSFHQLSHIIAHKYSVNWAFYSFKI